MQVSTARIIITGSSGQLARALGLRLGASADPARVWMPPEGDLDITDPERLRKAIREHRTDWIVNCAAYTAVDAAEKEAEKAYRINDAAVGLLADAALEGNAQLIHISTDYVFDGAKEVPYVEDDPTGPVNVYGASKLAGEIRLRSHRVRSAILRTAWLYSEGPRNFLRWAVDSGRKALVTGEALPVVTDQVGSPTDVHSLAAQIEEVITGGLEGTFHAVAGGSATWFEFAAEIFSQMGLQVPLRPILGENLGRLARRAGRVVLENRNLAALGRNRMPHWKDGLRGVIARLENGADRP